MTSDFTKTAINIDIDLAYVEMWCLTKLGNGWTDMSSPGAISWRLLKTL